MCLFRLHQLTVYGRTLSVEYAKACHEEFKPSELGDVRVSDQSPDSKKTSKAELRRQKELEVSQDINSTQSKLGIPYCMNPRLHYSYPSANRNIVANIANILLAVPKFYVQVLHLMNKMNLPAPFDFVPETSVLDVTPEVTSTKEDVTRTEQVMSESEDESELESDNEHDNKSSVKRRLTSQTRPHRKHKLQKITSAPKAARTVSTAEVFDVMERPTPRAAPLPSVIELRTEQTAGAPGVAGQGQTNDSHVVQEGGFGTLEQATSSNKEMDDNDLEKEHELDSCKFISSRALDKGRLSTRERRDMKVFHKYSRGEPNTRLYIKNLAKQVTTKDLHHIYGRYVNWKDEDETNMFDIRLMQEGRMKGQAFVTLPSVKVAQNAVEDTNGYVLYDKPCVVHFARSAKNTSQ